MEDMDSDDHLEAELTQLPVDAEKLARDRETVETGFWQKVRRTLGRIPFSEDAVAAYYCAVDSETPGYVRAVLLGALAYFVIPTDVIPDVIAGLGFTDDASVLLTALSAVGGNLKPHHRDQARAFLEREHAPAEPES
jgi:uncharacterized membrane protein YkvA (DUF1232 family)